MERLTGGLLSNAAPLFSGWEETMIYSCLQGCMGSVWVDNAASPRSAQAVLGDFCFLAGAPSAALAQNLAPFPHAFALLVPRDEQWCTLLEQLYAGRCERLTRYAFRKDSHAFSWGDLRRYAAALPPEYELRPIDKALYHQALAQPWSSDLCSQFPTWADFDAHGLGYVVLHSGVIAAGASTYSWYRGGIEIEVDTAEDYRRHGLALACSARLVMECLRRNLYPSWDAANLASASLAWRLGFLPAREYPTYCVQI